MTVSSSTTESPMSTDSSMSSTMGGSGTIISSTTARTAPGAMRAAVGLATGNVREFMSVLEHQLLDAHEIREHFGHRAEQCAGNRIADLGFLVEGAGERDVFDRRNAMFARDRLDVLRHEVGALGDD